MRRRLPWIHLCLMLSAVLTPALAAPTALNAVPTADVVPSGSASFAVQINGGPSNTGYWFFNQMQTQFGFEGDTAVGVDLPLGPNAGFSLNAKHRLCGEALRRPAVAVGAYYDYAGLGNPVYLTSYKTVGDSRLHVGSVYLDGAVRAMAGWELWHGGPLVLQADYVSGVEMYSSMGAVINWSNGMSLTVAQFFGNSSSAPNSYLVILGWTGKIR